MESNEKARIMSVNADERNKPQYYSARGLLERAAKNEVQAFFGNSGRKDERRNKSGVLYWAIWERRMREMGYYAAWADFAHRSHMDQVNPGDAILMYAKAVGIIAVGIATGRCEGLKQCNPNSVRNHESISECRIPVNWLHWNEDKPAPWSAKDIRCTFLNISDCKYMPRLRAVAGSLV